MEDALNLIRDRIVEYRGYAADPQEAPDTFMIESTEQKVAYYGGYAEALEASLTLVEGPLDAGDDAELASRIAQVQGLYEIHTREANGPPPESMTYLHHASRSEGYGCVLDRIKAPEMTRRPTP